jgi:hypothetical protein
MSRRLIQLNPVSGLLFHQQKPLFALDDRGHGHMWLPNHSFSSNYKTGYFTRFGVVKGNELNSLYESCQTERVEAIADICLLRSAKKALYFDLAKNGGITMSLSLKSTSIWYYC